MELKIVKDNTLHRQERQAIIDNIKIGLSISDSCKMAKVKRERFTQEMRRDGMFAEDVDAAEAEYKKRNMTLIQRAGATDWRASAWSLEHRYQKEFGIIQKVEHSGPGGGPIQIESADLSGFTKEELMGISKLNFTGTKAMNGNNQLTTDK